METVVINKLEKMSFYRSEAFKTLRSNIQFSGDDVKTIAVTSSIPTEGKSDISFNLAMELARSGKKVVYVDADLRKTLTVGRHRIEGAKEGLTHFLTKQCTINECIYATNVPNFHIITAGPVPPNPSALLGSRSFSQMLVGLKKVFDYVIIDTPPLASVIDAAVVAKECDGAVMVIKSNTVDRQLVSRTKKQLEMTGCRILGCVLAGVAVKKNSYYSKYYS